MQIEAETKTGTKNTTHVYKQHPNGPKKVQHATETETCNPNQTNNNPTTPHTQETNNKKYKK